MQTDIQFINTAEQLSAYCQKIQNTSVLALDTEFIREKTYHPKLCLIQVATEDTLVCIDPLAINDIEPLLDIIYNDNIVKVFHAASQDLEIFYLLRKAVPQNIFDTQIAASLLGYGDQLGYANLIKTILHTELDKGQSRTNWEQRPLHDKQIQYAANDVLYLLQAYPIIYKTLSEQNRLDWMQQNTQRLVSNDSYETNVDDIWQRVKYSNKLRGVQLSVLQHIARWREERAIEKNLPRKWIVQDEVVFDLARIMPNSTAELDSIRGIEKYQKSYSSFLELIELGKAVPKELWPETTNRIKVSSEQSAQIDIITAIIKLKAEENQVSQNNIATRKELEKLVTGNRDLKLIKQKWLYDIAGKAIVDFLEGRSTIKINNNKKIDFQ